MSRFLNSAPLHLSLMPNTFVLALCAGALLYALERFVEFQRAVRRAKGWPGYRVLFSYYVPTPWQYVPGVTINWGHFSANKYKRKRVN